MFAWDLFREFRDSLKIAKFNTSELEAKKLILFIKKKKKCIKQKNRIYMCLHY